MTTAPKMPAMKPDREGVILTVVMIICGLAALLHFLATAGH